MKLLFTFIMSLYMMPISIAQLGYNKHEIIELFGTDYDFGFTEDKNTPFMSYFYNRTNPSGESYIVSKHIYLNEDDICFIWIEIMPLNQINHMVKSFNQRLVTIGELQWKDYKSMAIFEILTDDEFAIIRCYHEEE